MNPTIDLKGEHDAMAIILAAMKKRAVDIRKGNYVDLFRIGQIIEFLRTYNDHCHHEKEERILFPALLECDIPWTSDTIKHLVNEHYSARICLNEIEDELRNYLACHSRTLDCLSSSMIKYVELEENHIKIENEVMLPLSQKVLSIKTQETISLNFRKIQNHHILHSKNLEYYILLTKLYSETKVVYATDFQS
jgi:hemerythrin-like domain-containing protein